MNIHELDSYDLSDAVKFNDELNPRIWGANEKMRPEVREQLLRIADDFREFLGIDVEVKDITVSGSNAAYTYTPHSDIDLHLVVDLPEADRNEVYRELFDAKKYAYNDMHNIQIGGYDVELYVQDANKTHHSQGIYSIMNDDWVSVPKRRRPDVDDISVKSKFEDLGHRIEQAIKSQDYQKISAMAEKIRDYRQAGLDAHGEFGPENLAFKILRTQGLIEKLYAARNAAKDQLLSLDERRKKKKKKSVRYGYGAYWYPGTAYAGQDHPAGTEGGDGGGDGGGESIREDSGTTDEQILKDFIDFCVKELKIEQMPRVKLRRDPQWPAVHKTFGRYNNENKILEVAWGQRHIMDVLRTVAHELTHKHQHEREGHRMGPDAGETGSPYENEANARAGVLMRDYGRLHPEYFTVGQAHDLEEDQANKTSVLQNRLPPKLVISGYTFTLDPATRQVTVTHGGKPFKSYRYTGPKNYDAYAANAYHAISGTQPRDLAAIEKRDRGSPTAAQQSFEYPKGSGYGVAVRDQDLERAYSQHDQDTEGHGDVSGINDLGKWGAIQRQRRRQAQQQKDDEVKETAPIGFVVPGMSADPVTAWKRQVRALILQYREDPTRLGELAKEKGEGSAEATAYAYLRSPTARIPLPPGADVTESASGYIPTKKQAKDPRFSMALTVDIKPGQVGKEANKLKLRTDKQGHPQIAKANGLFENLFVEYKRYKADEDYSPDEPPGPEFKPTMPKGTVRVDVSDVYDWYKLGQHISNMKGLGKHDFGKGPPSSIISFGDENTEHKFIKDLEATGLDVTDIDPVDPRQPPGKKIKTDPTYNVDEYAVTPDRDDRGPDEEEILRQYAAQWYNGDEDPRVEKLLATMGWEIGQNEDEAGGAFVIRSGDINGDSFISWTDAELSALNEISDELRRSYLGRAGQQVDRRQTRMAQVRDRLNKGYEIYHAEDPTRIVHRFEANTPAEARRYYERYDADYDSDVDYDLQLRRATGLEENLNELALRSTLPVTQTMDHPGKQVYDMKTQSGEYRIVFDIWNKDENFEDDPDYDGPTGYLLNIYFVGKTPDGSWTQWNTNVGEKQVAQIFATIAQLAAKIIKAHPEIDEIEIKGADPQRSRIYSRLMQQNIDSLLPGWKLGGEGLVREKPQQAVAEVIKMPPVNMVFSNENLVDWAYNDAQKKQARQLQSLKIDVPTRVYDMGDHVRVFVIDDQGPVLYLALEKFQDGFKTNAVQIHPRGQGKNLAFKVYQAVSDTFQRPLYSDQTHTDASRLGIWKKLIDKFPNRLVGYDQATREDLPLTATDQGPVVRGKEPIYVQKKKKDLAKPVTPQTRSRTRLLKFLPATVKQAVTEDEELDEVKMSPSALEKFATSPEARGIRAGFEAELIFRDTQGSSDDIDPEPDYDTDERAYSIQQVIDFFSNDEYGYGLSDRDQDRLMDDLDESYMNWRDEKMTSDFRNDAEDLIREKLLDETPLSERIHLYLTDSEQMSDKEADRIIAAGVDAPKFDTSKEQQAYAAENPYYQAYLDALDAAELELDESVEYSVSQQDGYWDEALDDYRDNWSGDDDSFFSDVGLRWMSDIANEYGLDWPVWNMDNQRNNGSRSWEDIGSELQAVVDMPVVVSDNYHSTSRRPGQWIIEPDGSLHPDDNSEEAGLEIVSPPMPLLTAIEKLRQVTDWANDPRGGNAYTNGTTGLHMGVSLPTMKSEDATDDTGIDYVKLILFMGDKYVQQQFGREANNFCASALDKFRQNIKGKRSDPAGVVELLRHGLTELAYRELQKGVGTSKYTSAHIQNGYIEFRSPGGDWLAKADEEIGILENTMLRFARAMAIAGDPSAERQEYAKKLYKLVTADNPEYADQLRLFSEFSAGTINKEQLKKQWADSVLQKEIPTTGQEEYEVFDMNKSRSPEGVIDTFYARNYDDANDQYTKKYVNDPRWTQTDVRLKQPWFDVFDDTGKVVATMRARDGDTAQDRAQYEFGQQWTDAWRVYRRPDEAPEPEKKLSPRAQVAKRITTKKIDYNYDIVSRNSNKVIDRFYAQTPQEAEQTYSAWLKQNSLPDDSEDYGYRKTAQAADNQRDSVDTQRRLGVQDIDTDVAQNFGQSQDATQRSGSWSIYDVTLGREISRMDNVPWQQANDRANELEQSTGHNMSVRGLSENVVNESIGQHDDEQTQTALDMAAVDYNYRNWADVEMRGSDQAKTAIRRHAVTKLNLAQHKDFNMLGKSRSAISKGVDKADQEFIDKQIQTARKLGDDVNENFADGKNPGRKGLSRRVGIPKKATLGQLEKIAKSSTGERRKMAQWQLNMRRGKAKKK